jgi:hypothetical protein
MYKTYFSKLAPNHNRKLFTKLYYIIFKDKVQVRLDDKIKVTKGDLAKVIT